MSHQVEVDFNRGHKPQHLCVMPAILVIGEAEVGKIAVYGSAQASTLEVWLK
jgi:hypothetical protein